MTYRIPLSAFVDQTARNAAAAAQSTANDASATASTAAQNAATALISAGTAQTAADNANTAAGNALAVASARNHIFIQAAQPTTSTLDDLWVDTANGRILGWDGSAWTVRQLGTAGIAASAITANLIAANAVGANQIAATAIDGKTITGATLRTAASGKRVQLDSANGLIAYNSSGQAVTQIRTSDGVLIAAGAVITGELNTGAAGSGRIRVYETVDGRGNPEGVIQLEDGVTGDTPAKISANAYGGTYDGGGLAISGGKYGSGPAAPTLVLQTDQAGLSQVQITAPDGLLLNGHLLSDSDWVDIPTRTGFTPNGTPQVRLINGILHFRNGWTNAGMATSSSYIVADLPAGFRPPAGTYARAGTASADQQGEFVLGSDGTVQVRTGSVLASYFRLDAVPGTPID